MEKFLYLTHQDHAQWYVDDLDNITLKKELLDAVDRVKLRKWINRNCSGKVYGWNGCKTPNTGEVDWGKKVSPQGDMIFYFENQSDKTQFILTWVN